MSSISNPSGAKVEAPATQAYNAAPPTSWTDLDLSAVVGTKSAVVVLGIDDNQGRQYAVRKNGDADEFYFASASSSRGCAYGLLIAADHIILLAVTDVNGVIEWIASSAAATTTAVDVIAVVG